MTLSYLIDGYNLIHALGLVRKQLAPRELESARRRLLDLLHERLEPRAGDITVIFDAKRKPRHVPAEFQEGRILVRYAGRLEEADDVIEALLTAHAAPQRLVVVSDDHRLRQAAARARARSLGCQELLDHLEKRDSAPPRPVADAAKEGVVPQAEVQKWLHEFGDVKLPNEYRDFLDPPASDD